MATRSEQFRAEEERLAHAEKTKRAARAKGTGNAKEKASKEKAPKKKSNGRTSRKATYAREETAPSKRPSRKSTRKSANRAKPDATFNRVEEQKKSSSDARFRKSRASRTKVRGAPQR